MGYLWLGKYIAQKLISTVPLGMEINALCQKAFGALRRPVIHGYPRTLTMLWLLGQCGVRLQDAICVELGTGWDLSSGLTLARAGASVVYTFDHVRHVRPELRNIATRMIESKDVPTDSDLPFSPPFGELVHLIGESRGVVHYQAPRDARATALPSESVDLYYSLATLEHIPIKTLLGLLQESFRVLRRGGYCYHYVQPAMHSWRGKESTIDYLVFSSKTWERWIANPIAYENRLRAVEYLELLTGAGFEIVHVWVSLDRAALAKLPGMRLAKEFERFTAEELSQDYIWIVARKP